MVNSTETHRYQTETSISNQFSANLRKIAHESKVSRLKILNKLKNCFSVRNYAETTQNYTKVMSFKLNRIKFRMTNMTNHNQLSNINHEHRESLRCSRKNTISFRSDCENLLNIEEENSVLLRTFSQCSKKGKFFLLRCDTSARRDETRTRQNVFSVSSLNLSNEVGKL